MKKSWIESDMDLHIWDKRIDILNKILFSFFIITGCVFLISGTIILWLAFLWG